MTQLPPEKRLKHVYIETYGCQMNEYDSSKMLAVLKVSHGMTPVATPEEADLLLLNTCSVREKAQEKVFSLIGRWKEQKDPGRRCGLRPANPAPAAESAQRGPAEARRRR